MKHVLITLILLIGCASLGCANLGRETIVVTLQPQGVRMDVTRDGLFVFGEKTQLIQFADAATTGTAVISDNKVVLGSVAKMAIGAAAGTIIAGQPTGTVAGAAVGGVAGFLDKMVGR